MIIIIIINDNNVNDDNNDVFTYDHNQDLKENILRSKKFTKTLEDRKMSNEIEILHKNADIIDEDSEKIM